MPKLVATMISSIPGRMPVTRMRSSSRREQAIFTAGAEAGTIGHDRGDRGGTDGPGCLNDICRQQVQALERGADGEFSGASGVRQQHGKACETIVASGHAVSRIRGWILCRDESATILFIAEIVCGVACCELILSDRFAVL